MTAIVNNCSESLLLTSFLSHLSHGSQDIFSDIIDWKIPGHFSYVSAFLKSNFRIDFHDLGQFDRQCARFDCDWVLSAEKLNVQEKITLFNLRRLQANVILFFLLNGKIVKTACRHYCQHRRKVHHKLSVVYKTSFNEITSCSFSYPGVMHFFLKKMILINKPK